MKCKSDSIFPTFAGLRFTNMDCGSSLGGLVTLATGIIAHKFGPAIGGLFLAYPAIFPASATLVEKHEIEKKVKRGSKGLTRGRHVAALDASGAVLGAIGLVGFAFTTWQLLTSTQAWFAFCGATAVWLAISLLAWRLRHARYCAPPF
jgi:Protein of unknown function (DUF3147)